MNCYIFHLLLLSAYWILPNFSTFQLLLLKNYIVMVLPIDVENQIASLIYFLHSNIELKVKLMYSTYVEWKAIWQTSNTWWPWWLCSPYCFHIQMWFGSQLLAPNIFYVCDTGAATCELKGMHVSCLNNSNYPPLAPIIQFGHNVVSIKPPNIAFSLTIFSNCVMALYAPYIVI